MSLRNRDAVAAQSLGDRLLSVHNHFEITAQSWRNRRAIDV
jgi:hypothetical protein